MLRSWRSLGRCEFWESELSWDVLSSLLSHDVLVSDDGGLDYVNGVSSGAVSSSHFTVEETHGVADGIASILLVHVKFTLSGLIFKHNAVIFDGVSFSLKDLAD